MAYSCKSVAILASEGTGEKNITDMAYRYGQNIGIAFQLMDDWLDFVSSAEQLGKGGCFLSSA
jgi:geranylgeranyl pyrophosphate synthase